VSGWIERLPGVIDDEFDLRPVEFHSGTGSQVTVRDGGNEAILNLTWSASALSPEPCIPEGY